MNGFEHEKITTSNLPETWLEGNTLQELESFLQENWEQRSIFYSDQEITSRQQFIDFDVRNGIKLKNYIGTIIYKGEQLNIFPKVFMEDDNDFDKSFLDTNVLIDNLVVWLGYCDRLNFPFVSMKGEFHNSSNLLELFITVYIHYVKSAFEHQRFFRYEEVSEIGSMVKGKIDFTDYVTKRYPYGNFAEMKYTYSSFVFDNALNRIIKSTCRFLYSITTNEASKVILRDLIMRLSDVKTIHAQPYDCDKISLSHLHSRYRVILSMSKMFLLNASSNNMGHSDTFCFLFPAELLFEGFIGGFLKEAFSSDARIRTQTSDQYLAELIVNGEVVGNTFNLREDILIESETGIVILDTKYKSIERFEKIMENRKLDISDNDMKQMAIYAAKRNAKRLYLLFPLRSNEEPETIDIRYDIKLDEDKKVIPLIILKVPFVFDENVEQQKRLLRDILKDVVH